MFGRFFPASFGRPWVKLLAWAAVWGAVIAAAQALPTWAAIVLAVAVFAVQVLGAPGRSACHLPPAGVTNATPGGPK